MNGRLLHAWDLTPTQAVALQRELAAQVDVRSPLVGATLVAGADVSYSKFSKTLYVGVVVLNVATGEVVEEQTAVCEAQFPYVPGLLSFREAPPVLATVARLRTKPQVLMSDGQGYAHPRRIGIACHVGLWLDLPTLGCAKSLLIGKHKELKPGAGAKASLKDRDEVIGMAVRTKERCKPVYVSAGHKIDLPSSVAIVLASCRGYRIPEPTRQAHLLVNRIRRTALGAT